ncbi:MAG: hypothetical protein P8P70_06360 [Sulfitobacter sp.]|nr:hypothetical protein [Sulfitobacter sp.]
MGQVFVVMDVLVVYEVEPQQIQIRGDGPDDECGLGQRVTQGA